MGKWLRRLGLGLLLGTATLPQADVATNNDLPNDTRYEVVISADKEFRTVLSLAKKANILLPSHDAAWFLRQLPAAVRDEYTKSRRAPTSSVVEDATLSVCVEVIRAYRRFNEAPTFENAEIFLGFVQLAREISPASPFVVNFIQNSRSVVHQALRANNK